MRAMMDRELSARRSYRAGMNRVRNRINSSYFEGDRTARTSDISKQT
jgi:hypothetical protein